MFRLIKADGTTETREHMTLEEMQEFVGGYIEYSGNVICNEEGLLLHLPQNKMMPNFVGNIIIEIKSKNKLDKDVL